MTFLIHPEADREVDDAAVWYDGRSPGLGLDFLAAVRLTYADIRANPRQYPPAADAPAGREVREAVLRRFPHRLVYFIRGMDIVVVALAHFRRKPGYWYHRLTP